MSGGYPIPRITETEKNIFSIVNWCVLNNTANFNWCVLDNTANFNWCVLDNTANLTIVKKNFFYRNFY